ncbi:MAG: hypothetical protein EOP21_00300 [Hyphomicrobiales bacterium]|nr:MAG: hypothetical protein EOP21_00300 [Hyphomicrobiales bacterium]
MFIRKTDLHQYSIGYFSRKHHLERESARLILSVSRDAREANRLARTIKFKPKASYPDRAAP